jgi:hypothetical protein
MWSINADEILLASSSKLTVLTITNSARDVGRGLHRRSLDGDHLPSRVTPPDQATETRTGAPAYGPRSARVRYPASLWVAHCVGLMLAMGCVLGLLLGLALWRWVSSGRSSAVSGDRTQTMPAPVGYTSRPTTRSRVPTWTPPSGPRTSGRRASSGTTTTPSRCRTPPPTRPDRPPTRPDRRTRRPCSGRARWEWRTDWR